MVALKGGAEGALDWCVCMCVCVCLCVMVWDSDDLFVYICAVCLAGGGGLIVMHVDGFRDTSFQKQGPH